MKPQMGLLPMHRLTPYVRPFSYTGMTFLLCVSVGNLTCHQIQVREEHGKDLPSRSKRPCILFYENTPRLETLHIDLIEAENMVKQLTPNHFLLGCCNSTQTPAALEPRLMCLHKQWKHAQNLKMRLWHQWVREYQPELTRQTKLCTPSTPLAWFYHAHM